MKILVLALLLFLSGISCQPSANRVVGSPYPVSHVPTDLYVTTERGFTPDEQLLVESLQGLLAQTIPRILRVPLGDDGAQLWSQNIQQKKLANLNYAFASNISGLLQHFRTEFKGYVLYDYNSTNVAISLAGVAQSIVASTTLIPFMESLAIPLIKDVRNLTTQWFLQNFGDHINPTTFNFQFIDKATCLADYAIFGKALSFFEPANTSSAQEIFQRYPQNSAIFGWGQSEWNLVAVSSAMSMMVHAADWAINLSVMSNFQNRILSQKPQQTISTIPGTHTVCFLFTDGDNLQWLLKQFATSNQWFGSPDRGKTNIGWTLSPAIAELAPNIMEYLYDAASDRINASDYFVSGPSGLGYAYPEFFPERGLQSYLDLTARYLSRSDMHIVNIIAGTYEQHVANAYLGSPEIDAMFYYLYRDYSGLEGKITWSSNGKPAIGGRYNLWQGFETAESLAAKLNRSPRDIRFESAYSLIPVHAWSRNVTDVVRCTQLLGPNVRVVTPKEFVQLIRNNVIH